MNYKVGDKVRVKSLEWYNENKNELGVDVNLPNIIFVPNMSSFCGQECTIRDVTTNPSTNVTYYGLEEDVLGYSWTCDMFERLVERNELNKAQDNEQTFKAYNDVDCLKPVVFENIVFPNENYADKVELCLGDDYEIVVEDDRTFVQRKKSKYPKTYEECCKVLGIDEEMIVEGGWYRNGFVRCFYKLLICRDAYWKIAGNWKPDYDNTRQEKWGTTKNFALPFPNKEMLDAFNENFKDLVEKCENYYE